MSNQKQQKPLCPFKRIIERDYSGQRGMTAMRESSMFAPEIGAWPTSGRTALASVWSRTTGDRHLRWVQVAGADPPTEMHLLRPEPVPEGLL